MVQYHALSLLYKIKQHDRLAVSKIVQQLSKGKNKSCYDFDWFWITNQGTFSRDYGKNVMWEECSNMDLGPSCSLSSQPSAIHSSFLFLFTLISNFIHVLLAPFLTLSALLNFDPGSLRSPLATCLLVRYTSSLLHEDMSSTNARTSYQFLENCLRHKNEMVWDVTYKPWFLLVTVS